MLEVGKARVIGNEDKDFSGETKYYKLSFILCCGYIFFVYF